MPIELTQPAAARTPVVAARGLGQTINGMVVNVEMRARRDRDGNPILNGKGRPAQEEIVTIIAMPGTTGLISGGDLTPDRTPDPGETVRLIFKGLGYGRLIDARREVNGPVHVGDVITVTSRTATIWRGAGDILSREVDDPATIDKARSKGLSIGWDLDISYRRALPTEAALVADAETRHNQMKNPIAIAGPFDDDDSF